MMSLEIRNHMKRKLLIIELNEFNTELLKNAAKKFRLINIRKILNMSREVTFSEEVKEHHGLDPWVQWVSIHTGVSFRTHKIKHLGQVNNLTYPQIWETLSKYKIKSGIWGALNSSKGKSDNCLFFFPDPWSYSEKAYPKVLNNFLAFPRYFSKNYLAIGSYKFLISILKFISFFIRTDILFILRKDFFYIIRSILKQPLSSNLLFSLFDLISSRVFLKYQNKMNPDFLIIFLNSLAHSQHKYWRKISIGDELEFTLKNIDRILGIIFESISSEYALIVMNGLTQSNVEGKGYCIYRQINPEKFLKFIGLDFVKVEQCMTNDCFIFFKNKDDLLNAFNRLSKIEVNNKKLFYLEFKDNEENKLFYQFDYYDRLDKEALFHFENLRYKFFDHFSLLGERTGSHQSKGDIFSNDVFLKSGLKNYEINKLILEFFQLD